LLVSGDGLLGAMAGCWAGPGDQLYWPKLNLPTNYTTERGQLPTSLPAGNQARRRSVKHLHMPASGEMQRYTKPIHTSSLRFQGTWQTIAAGDGAIA